MATINRTCASTDVAGGDTRCAALHGTGNGEDRLVDLVAGRPWTYVNNVSRPTMMVYSPQGENTGVAAVVFPDGGYQVLAIDLEGAEVCD